MPFQYETFNNGSPISGRQLQKTTSNQFELSQTYQERSRGLVGHQILNSNLGSGTLSITRDDGAIAILSFGVTIYPNRYYLVEGQIGRIRTQATAGTTENALFCYLTINNIFVSVMNEVNELLSSTYPPTAGMYINHVWQSPSSLPANGKETIFELLIDEAVYGSSYDINYSPNTYQGNVRLSVIDLGAVTKGNYYG